MPGGNKKKKTKPAANPARGFATTSVASKPKSEPVSEVTSRDVSVIPTPAEKDASTTLAGTSNSRNAGSGTGRELHELNPEELEAQLEASELQQFVERHAAKVKKEAARQVSRLQTDKRLFRGQADFLSVKDWLPEELMEHILDLILADWRRDGESVKTSKLPLGDDLIAKVWQLRQCLLDLALPLARINAVLSWVVSNPPAQTSASSIWGLEESFEWLALHCDPHELDEYDYVRQRVIADAAGKEKNDDSATKPDDGSIGSTSKKDTPLINDEAESSPTSDREEDIEVSDADSDLEPDELLALYLRTKARLHELNPEIDNKSKSKGPKAPPRTTVKSASERKLEQRLQRIESDVLFDKRDADARWAGMKIELRREAAERRKLQLQQDAPDQTSIPSGQAGDVNDEAERVGQEVLKGMAEDDDEMLGGMFDALPGVEQPAKVSGDSNACAGAHVIIRDLGRLTGMNPKRVLEEACRSRNSRCKIVFEQVSATTYSCRHSVSVLWTKEQDTVDDTYLPTVSVIQKPLYFKVTAIQVATPDAAQSEAYAATAALFLIFSGSPKEEKAHLRLPAAFRDLWDEFANAKQNHILAADGLIVKEVRELVEKNRHVGGDEGEEVVFNASIRRRLDGTNGITTPVSRTGTPTPVTVAVSDELQQMWQRKVSTLNYQRMLVGRMNLPMFQFRTVALDTIHRHQVTILCGETGCGKSTQLPAFILEDQLSSGRNCKIYCTEPRRISAISLAHRVSEEMGENKGDVGTARSLVGYAIRLESQTTAQTRLVYATVGIVLRMLENTDGLGDITHLIIDEVHERSIDTDFLLIVLQSLMTKRPDLKVVLMSATVDAQRFSQYLNNAPIINVPGRTFPVEAKFLEDAIELTGHTNEDASQNAFDEDSAEDDTKQNGSAEKQQVQGYSKRTQNTLTNYDEYRIDLSLIVKLIEKISYKSQYEAFSKAILVFLPGIAEIRQLNDMLAGHPKFQKEWRLHPLHSTFSSEDQQAAFEIPPDRVRKIVMATNIAETGITIPDVTCVIDTGKHKEMRFDERRQMSRLLQSFIAKANAKQRRGRAGRVQPGICFHLFTRYRHDHLMAEQQTPEMLRLSLQDLVMRVKIYKLGDVEHALSQALDPPSNKNIRRAIDALVEVGALTEKEELTSLGSQLAKLPLDAQLGKLILLGSNFGCLDFALTIAATLSSKSPFLNPMHQKKAADTVRFGFKRGDSDLLTVYNAYCAWRKVCSTPGLSEYPFCNKNFLSPQNLANIEEVKAQLLTSLMDAGFVQLGPDDRHALSRMRYNSRHRKFVSLPPQYVRADDNNAMASSVVAWSFYPKIIKQEGKGWRNIANNQSLGLHPTSVNKGSFSPDIKYLSFYSIMQSSSRFTTAQETTPASEIPLVLMAGEATFHWCAGVIVIDGNRLRFKVKDWKTLLILKTLRTKIREVMGKLVKNPGRDLGDRPRRWMDVLEKLFERQKVPHPPPPQLR